MPIRVLFVGLVVPRFEVMAEHEVEFQVKMRARLIEAGAGVTHHRDMFAPLHGLPNVHVDLAEMTVQTVIGRTIPAMLDYDVFPIVGVGRHEIGVNDSARTDRAYFVEWFSVYVAMQAADVDSFMKPRINNARRCLDWIAYETVLAAFPRR